MGVPAALTLDHPGTSEAHEAWGAATENSPDLERVVDAVRIRQGMDEDALLSHIVLTAGVPKSSRSLTGARTIVDILEFAGAIEETDGTFGVRSAEPDGGTAFIRITPSGVEEAQVSKREHVQQPSQSGVVINIHVWVNVNDVDFAGLADELKEFLAKLTTG